MVPPRSPAFVRFSSSLPRSHSVIKPTTSSAVGPNPVEFAASMPTRLRAASITATGALLPGFAGRKFGLMLGLLSGMTLFGPRLDLGARPGEPAQPLFPPLKFFRDRKAFGNIGLISRL